MGQKNLNFNKNTKNLAKALGIHGDTAKAIIRNICWRISNNKNENVTELVGDMYDKDMTAEELCFTMLTMGYTQARIESRRVHGKSMIGMQITAPELAGRPDVNKADAQSKESFTEWVKELLPEMGAAINNVNSFPKDMPKISSKIFSTEAGDYRMSGKYNEFGIKVIGEPVNSDQYEARFRRMSPIGQTEFKKHLALISASYAEDVTKQVAKHLGKDVNEFVMIKAQ